MDHVLCSCSLGPFQELKKIQRPSQTVQLSKSIIQDIYCMFGNFNIGWWEFLGGIL